MDEPKLFPYGRLLITATATNVLDEEEAGALFRRHLSGDWGDLDAADAKANEQALKHGERLLSCYATDKGRFYVITEWDRSVTTLLPVSDY